MPREISAKQTIPKSLQDRLRDSERITVLSGAGISAESGIPTFRQAQTGLWARYDPMRLASPEGFAEDPGLVWRWYQWRRKLVDRSEPNAGHRALVELARTIPELRLITQNVDGLHQRAGARSVIELHGNLARTVCSRTRRAIDPDWLERHAEQEPPPSPHHPQGLARPDVVWFGEALDAHTLEQACQAASDCELMLIVGTSGLVHPAAGLPRLAASAGACLVEVNPERTALSDSVDWRLVGPSAECLPRLVERI
ncbi:SIR2 family NAD-dependent protein deacylase [Wenzhouxiangella marina]|uniref:NAD-dependent protein deacylase n=1 Tax=Wenzhouxiangella marina TaxID=1579979 RepID=A0A0K0XVR9_9GAMM|nr:NAD-dependent deacylase [Wenzhouxiangella marina]AKS41717.1 NAD-dependent protein deacylase [Wenzhouxiangella marina]MBB6086521.1 NAD-dependent deacetylase [Wenzhouxiangella marina]